MLLHYVYLVIGPKQKFLIILGHVGLNCIRKLMLIPKVWIEILMKWEGFFENIPTLYSFIK